ncbi:MAG: hypothetical protein JWS10_3209 [Cypionkella sp.]|nr:hypothetical protein [Cypionkella sp.]
MWHIGPDGPELERLHPPAAPQYDFARIRSVLAELQRFDADWLRWFEAEGIAPLRVRYEDLAADPLVQVARICAALGLVMPENGELKPGVAKLADAVSAGWIERYRLELRSSTSSVSAR